MLASGSTKELRKLRMSVMTCQKLRCSIINIRLADVGFRSAKSVMRCQKQRCAICVDIGFVNVGSCCAQEFRNLRISSMKCQEHNCYTIDMKTIHAYNNSPKT